MSAVRVLSNERYDGMTSVDPLGITNFLLRSTIYCGDDVDLHELISVRLSGTTLLSSHNSCRVSHRQLVICQYTVGT
jgi:hypothetical protein